MLLVSQALLWSIVLLLAGAVAALARQVGLLHERIAPIGALALGQGPQAGEQAPRLAPAALDGSVATIGGARESGRPQLLFFAAPSCPICKQLLPTARRFAESEALDLLLVGDGETGQLKAMAARFHVAEGDFVNSPEAGQAFRVGKLPYAVLIDPRGTIVAQGLVNTREHLESLTHAGESGFSSIQDYLGARKAKAADKKAADKGVTVHG